MAAARPSWSEPRPQTATADFRQRLRELISQMRPPEFRWTKSTPNWRASSGAQATTHRVVRSQTVGDAPPGFLAEPNPDDAALMVEKRGGAGLTVNFGNPWSWVLCGLLAANLVTLSCSAFMADFSPADVLRS